MTSHPPFKQTGFSLIELVTVLLIITVLSTIAIRSTVDIGYSVRYEQTRDRLESLRKAIVGDPKRSINGQPDISGFVADMGRLPDNIREVFQTFVCFDTSTSPKGILTDTPSECVGVQEDPVYLNTPCTDSIDTDRISCEANAAPGNVWLGKQTENAISGLTYGWNGPYLNISDNPTNTDAYPDGWGRETQGYCSDLQKTDAASCIGGETWTTTANDFNYGWYFRLDANEENLTLFSYGKDNIYAGTEYDADTPVPEGTETEQPYLAENDWRTPLDNGINIFFQKNNSINGSCGIYKGLESTFARDVAACRNASGLAGNSCQLTKTSCEDAGIGGIWNAMSNSCEHIEPDCTGAGRTWDTITSTCHISKSQCTTAPTPVGVWKGTVPLVLSPTICDTKGGNWSGATGLCTFATATPCTTNLQGEWDSVSKTCDFKMPGIIPTTLSPCITAGGAWNGTTCTITPSSWANFNDATWGCSISQTTCNATGGAWNRCDFNPLDCNDLTGGSWQSYCEFTDSNCTRTGGNWNAITRQCVFATSATCTAAGFNWNGASCDLPIQEQCTNAGISWASYCELDTSANCTGTDGVWNSATTPKLCGFSSANCLSTGGIPRSGNCSISQAEHNGIPFNQQSCQQANGLWLNEKKSICLNVFYKSNGSHQINRLASNPLQISEDGSFQNFHFNFPDGSNAECTNNDGFNDGIWNGVTCDYGVPIGNSSVAVYEGDGDCVPFDQNNPTTTNPFYPSDRAETIPLIAVPNNNLSVINW